MIDEDKKFYYLDIQNEDIKKEQIEDIYYNKSEIIIDTNIFNTKILFLKN
jgi:hypothetical protein